MKKERTEVLQIERSPGDGVAHAVPGKACQYDVLVKQADVKVTGNGKTFINAIVEDVTGRIECIQWDPTTQDVDAFTNHAVVQVRGKCGTYKDKPQVTVGAVYVLAPEQVDWKHVLAASPIDYEGMCNLRASMIDRIGSGRRDKISEPLAEIVDALTSTNDFLNAPAATFMHHAYVHGLLEHSLSVCTNAIRYVGLDGIVYGRWDIDVVLAGALLHDVGKINEYTMTGKRLPAAKMLGHCLMGCEMLAQAAMTVSIDMAIVDQIKHVIAAHHGRLEWGAVVEPQTSEAWLVHAMDLADSRLFATAKRAQE